MKRLLISLLFSTLLYNYSLAQTRSVLQARTSVIHDISSHPHKPIMAIGVSFINNSEKDIYIPAIARIIKGQNQYIVNVYRLENSEYKLVPDSIINGTGGLGIGSKIPGMTKLTSKFRSASNEIIKQQIAELKGENGENSNVDLDLFLGENRALFLKAGEEHQYFFTCEINNPMYKEGKYAFVFEPDFSKLNGDSYPEAMGYEKFIPTEIESNRMEVHLINEYGK